VTSLSSREFAPRPSKPNRKQIFGSQERNMAFRDIRDPNLRRVIISSLLGAICSLLIGPVQSQKLGVYDGNSKPRDRLARVR
jgi:hypothetical protein